MDIVALTNVLLTLGPGCERGVEDGGGALELDGGLSMSDICPCNWILWNGPPCDMFCFIWLDRCSTPLARLARLADVMFDMVLLSLLDADDDVGGVLVIRALLLLLLVTTPLLGVAEDDDTVLSKCDSLWLGVVVGGGGVRMGLLLCTEAGREVATGSGLDTEAGSGGTEAGLDDDDEEAGGMGDITVEGGRPG